MLNRIMYTGHDMVPRTRATTLSPVSLLDVTDELAC